MNTIYILLIEWAIPIYFVSGISLILSLLRLIQAQTILRQAMFSLELETGREIRASALFVIFACLFAISSVLYVNYQVAPSLPPELLLPPTSTPDIFSTPLSSPTPLGGNSEPAQAPVLRVTPDLVATATLDPEIQSVLDNQAPSVSTLSPEQAAAGNQFIPEGGGCNPAVNITQPRPDSTVFGTVEFQGTASSNSFGAYLLEVQGVGTGGNWIDILGGRVFDRIENGVLGAINLSTIENGAYEARLTLFNLSGDVEGRCTILFNVNNE